MTDGSGTDVVAFSSRGPTNDGRIKPDVVAPGTFILSTRSRFIAPNHTGWAKFAPNKDYFFMGGTSMATPLVAGAIALIRQFLRTKKKIRRPSAALLKATLIHGAERMDYRYSAETRKGLYDMEQGWGPGKRSTLNRQNSCRNKVYRSKEGPENRSSQVNYGRMYYPARCRLK